MICDCWDVVIVPFPFTDISGSKRRPALVLSQATFNRNGYTIMAIITTADGSNWPLDTAIQHEKAGLKHACVVRMKLFTIDNRLIIRSTGVLSDEDRSRILASLECCLPPRY